MTRKFSSRSSSCFIIFPSSLFLFGKGGSYTMFREFFFTWESDLKNFESRLFAELARWVVRCSTEQT